MEIPFPFCFQTRVISTIHHRSHWQSQGNAELVARTFACEFLVDLVLN